MKLSEATCIPLETIYRALLDDFPFTVNYFALLRNAWLLFVNTETGLLYDNPRLYHDDPYRIFFKAMIYLRLTEDDRTSSTQLVQDAWFPNRSSSPPLLPHLLEFAS